MKTKDRIYFLVILILSLAGLIFQTVTLHTAYEPGKQLYVSGPLATALSVLLSVGALVAVSALLTLRADGGKRLPRLPKEGRAIHISQAVAMFGAAMVFGANVGTVILFPTQTVAQTGVQTVLVSAGSMICSLIYLAYLFSERAKPGVRALLGVGSMAWCVFVTLQVYFDMSYAIASGSRTYSMLTMLAYLMFLTTEARYHAADGKKHQYFAAGFALIFFAFSYSLPMLIYLLSGAEYGILQVAVLFAQVGGGVYALFRILSFSKSTSEETEMEYTFKYYEKLADVNWDDVPKAMVDKYGWGYEYTPLCYARGVYAEDTGLVVKLTCHEQNPRATLTEFMDDVCNDSCMEFFFAGDQPEYYANFEFNALGTQHTSLKKEGVKGSIDQFTEIPHDEAKIYDDRWELTLTLTPKNVLDITGKELARGAVFHGNFYKCGDECEQIHYGMWSEVKTEKPSFHQPQFFGTLTVG